MKKLTEEINSVLANWDPIGVGKEMAIDEYKSYIPPIIQLIDDKEKLMTYLEDLLINEMELDYDPYNKNHSKDLEFVCDEIVSLKK